MDALIVGFDLCDSYTQMTVYNEETKDVDIVSFGEELDDIPTTICKSRRKDEWFIGEEACKMALIGTGIVVDKLLRSVKKGGVATLEGLTYSAEELMKIYLEKSLDSVKKKYGRDIKRVIFTVTDLDMTLMDVLMRCTGSLGIERDNITVLSHSESFLYYLLRQPAETFANISVCLDLSKEGMTYYECNILRGLNPQIAQVSAQELEEGFSLDILGNPQGKKLADNILYTCVERQFGKKIITSVFLAGKGMENIQDWGTRTLPKMCNRRKAYLDTALFAKGAAWMGVSEEYPEELSYPYCMIGRGRILAGISMSMQVKGNQKSIILLSAGEHWYGTKGSVEFLLDGADSLDLEVLPAGTKKPFVKKISLGEMPIRAKRTTRVHLDVEFISETILKVRISDMGFGDIFPSSGCVIERELEL